MKTIFRVERDQRDEEREHTNTLFVLMENIHDKIFTSFSSVWYQEKWSQWKTGVLINGNYPLIFCLKRFHFSSAENILGKPQRIFSSSLMPPTNASLSAFPIFLCPFVSFITSNPFFPPIHLSHRRLSLHQWPRCPSLQRWPRPLSPMSIYQIIVSLFTSDLVPPLLYVTSLYLPSPATSFSLSHVDLSHCRLSQIDR